MWLFTPLIPASGKHRPEDPLGWQPVSVTESVSSRLRKGTLSRSREQLRKVPDVKPSPPQVCAHTNTYVHKLTERGRQEGA